MTHPITRDTRWYPCPTPNCGEEIPVHETATEVDCPNCKRTLEVDWSADDGHDATTLQPKD